MGTVVNRAGDKTSISEVTDTVGTEAFGVIPEDARTAALEPVFFSVPGSPAANAYGRLAGKTRSWDGTSALVGQASADGGDDPDAGRGGGTDDEDDDDSGGFLSGLLGDD
jgi:hypothetical protein